MYSLQNFRRAVVLSILLGVLLFTTPTFCQDVIPGFDTLEGDYVLVHGYRFSQMYDTRAKELIWLPASTIQNPSVTQRMDLALSIRANESDGFVTQGLLKSVATLKIYETFSNYMQELQQQNGSQFKYHEFAYDWRRSVAVSAQSLVKFLEGIYNGNGNKPINVLSHSLGGPVTLLAIQQRPELFSGSIFVGGAFQGGPYIYREVKFGLANLDPKLPPLQDDASCFTMRPEFSIVPPTSVFVDSNNQPINIDPFDVNVWTQSTFSDVLNGDSPRSRQLGTKEQRLRYLRRTLMASRGIYNAMQPKQSIDYPPFVVLTSDSFQTVTGFPMGKNSDGLWQINYDQPLMGKGDNILPFESTVPTGFPHEIIKTNTDHTSQFENLQEVGAALAKLHDMQGN